MNSTNLLLDNELYFSFFSGFTTSSQKLNYYQENGLFTPLKLMKNLILLFCLFYLIACNQKQISPLERPLAGTYSVTHLKQYQNSKLVFEGNLPAVIGNKLTIKHALSVSLSKLKSSSTDAFISYSTLQSWGNYSRSYGHPIANNQISLKATQRQGMFNFYTNNAKLLGSSDGNTLSFDFTEADSLGHPVRYVYEAKKISSIENYCTFQE